MEEDNKNNHQCLLVLKVKYMWEMTLIITQFACHSLTEWMGQAFVSL